MKYYKTLIISLICLINLMMSCHVLAGEQNSYGEALNLLGIFSGTEKGYEMERVPTRAEALVMTIRLSGKEDEALSFFYPHPFTDISWEESYVSYGYHHGIINGIAENNFGGREKGSLKQYCAILLRVLGYSEREGDFRYENAISFASLVLGEEIAEGNGFNRGQMAELTCYALNTRKKGSSQTLGQTLAQEGVFSLQMLANAQKAWEQEKEHMSTTVLVYAIGSDLESQQGRLSRDVREILAGEPKDNCRVLIQTGGTLFYHNEEMTKGQGERFQVAGSTLKKIGGSITTGASSPETLTNFIKWGTKEAPSERYILVFWDHGYGIKGGFGADELNQRKTMKVSELSSALAEAKVFFDIIAFDACLMGTAETAFAFRNLTKYLIASEDATPACGLYYTTWIGALERNPTLSTKRLGRLILDSFTLHAGIEANIPTTLSMMKMSRAGDLIDAMSKFQGNVVELAGRAQLLGKNEGVFDQFDLSEIMGQVPEISVCVQALAFEVRNTPGNRKYSGVAMYVPSRKPEDGAAMKNELKRIGLENRYIEVVFRGVKEEMP